MREAPINYVSTVYDEIRTPRTDYPAKLAEYICTRFGLSPGDRFLEVGFGRGDFLDAFQRRGLNVSGIDRELPPQFDERDWDVKACDLSTEKIPYPDGTFDAVYHKSVIEHFYDPMPLMHETRRVLKPGGKLIFLTPDWHTQFRVFYEDFTHCRPFDTLAVNDLLNICAMQDVRSERFYQLPMVWKYPFVRPLCALTGFFIRVPLARRLTELTGIKFFRWSSELMVLGYGVK